MAKVLTLGTSGIEELDLDPTIYYQEVSVENEESTTLTDYQVKFIINTSALISAGKLNAEATNMRVLDSVDNPVVFGYINETWNTTTTEFWLKIDSFSASATNVYKFAYGNSNWTSKTADLDDVMLFVDEFEGSTLDLTKWTVTLGNSPTVASGKVTMNGVVESRILGTMIANNVDCVHTFYGKLLGAGSYVAAEYNWNNSVKLWKDGSGNAYFNAQNTNGGVGTTSTNIGASTSGTQKLEVVNDYSNLRGRRRVDEGTWDDLSANYNSVNNKGSYIRNILGFNSEFEYIHIRKYTANEPTVAIGSEEEYGSTGYTYEDTSRTINFDNSMTVVEIQALINGVGRHLSDGITITMQCANGTYGYSSPIVIQGFYGGGNIVFQGDTTETNATALHTTQSVIFNMTDSSGIEITGNRNGNITVQNLKINLTGLTSSKRGIDVADSSAKVYISYNYFTFDNVTYGYAINNITGNIQSRYNYFYRGDSMLRSVLNGYTIAYGDSWVTTAPAKGVNISTGAVYNSSDTAPVVSGSVTNFRIVSGGRYGGQVGTSGDIGLKSSTTGWSSSISTSGANVNFATEVYKDSNGYTHSTSTNPEQIVVESTGYYNINYKLSCQNLLADRNTIVSYLTSNGTTVAGSTSRLYLRTTTYGQYGTNDFIGKSHFIKGSIIRLFVIPSSGNMQYELAETTIEIKLIGE